MVVKRIRSVSDREISRTSMYLTLISAHCNVYGIQPATFIVVISNGLNLPCEQISQHPAYPIKL
jgi:hypothetical protein